jgi:hypothetical protein
MTITQIFMVLIVVIIFIMDVYLIRKHGKPASFSAYIIRYVNYNRLAFFTTLLVGFVLGHILWSMPTESVYNNIECIEVENEFSSIR